MKRLTADFDRRSMSDKSILRIYVEDQCVSKLFVDLDEKSISDKINP